MDTLEDYRQFTENAALIPLYEKTTERVAIATMLGPLGVAAAFEGAASAAAVRRSVPVEAVEPLRTPELRTEPLPRAARLLSLQAIERAARLASLN